MFHYLMQSERIYNAGWTMDIRDINNHLREEYPDAPLYLVGLSIGANIVVRLSVFFFVVVICMITIIAGPIL